MTDPALRATRVVFQLREETDMSRALILGGECILIDGVHDVANEFTCDTRKKDQGKAFKHELITFSSSVPCSALAAGIRKEGGPTIVYNHGKREKD